MENSNEILNELTNILQQIQEKLSKLNTEVERNQNKNNNQDKEIEELRLQIDKIIRKFDDTDYQIQKVNLKVEQLWNHLDNSWLNKLKEDMQKFVTEMTAKNYEFMLTVMEEKMSKERKRADFWYKLILGIFGTGGLIAILLNYFL